MRARSMVTAASALLAFLAIAAPAAAEPGPIELVSTSATEQAVEAGETALSADGPYLAFRASIGGLEGVFRKDLQTGALVPVAVGSAYSGEPSTAGIASDAEAPSIS